MARNQEDDMRIRAFAAVTAVSLLLSGAAFAQNDQPGHTSPKPGSNSETMSALKDSTAGVVGKISAEMTHTAKGFVDAAAVSDMYEVEAGTIAVERGHSKTVKDFGKKMVDAHTATTNQLKSILASNNINATPPAALDNRRQGMIDDLKGAKAADFDHRYVEQQVAAHKEAETLMRGYSKDGDNAALKGFAADTLPKVADHLSMAEAMEKDMSIASK
jgi:putative membrane protein